MLQFAERSSGPIINTIENMIKFNEVGFLLIEISFRLKKLLKKRQYLCI